MLADPQQGVEHRRLGADGHLERVEVLALLVAAALGIPYVLGQATGISRARYYPGVKKVKVKLLAEPGSLRLIGAQMVGQEGIKERADFLGFLDRVRWLLPTVYLAGLGGAAFLGGLFLRTVLRPYAALASAARDLQALTPDPLPEAAEGDVESVPGLFRRLVDRLQRQEAELSRLYTGGGRRGGAAAVEESILGSITSGVISVRPDLTLMVFNRPALQIFGRTEGEVLGRACQEVFGGERFAALEGANVQRPLWASTGVKDPDKPNSREMPIKDYVRTKLEEEKDKKLLEEVVANNHVEVPEDFTIPQITDEQLQEFQQKQQSQMPGGPAGAAPGAPGAPKVEIKPPPGAKPAPRK